MSTIMLHATPQELGNMLDAAMRVGTTCGEALADKATSFTCGEAEAINDLLVATGEAYWAEEFRWHHADGDTEDSDLHREVWARPEEES